MKKNIFTVLFCFVTLQLFCQNLEKYYGRYYCYAGYFDITPESYATCFGDSETPPAVEMQSCTVHEKDRFIYLETENSQNFLFPAGDFMYVVTKDRSDGSIRHYAGNRKKSNRIFPFIYGTTVKGVSSYLTETRDGKTVNYRPAYSGPSQIPWIPANKKNESITIAVDYNHDGRIREIYCINGFFQTDRTDLFWKNCRIKTVKAEIGSKKQITTFDNDDASLKKIKLPVPINKNEKTDITITILDVYPGSEYQDAAISGLIWLCY